MPARGIAPGIAPHAMLSALKGRRGFLRPFRAHRNRWIPEPRALPWASMHRRFQRRKTLYEAERRAKTFFEILPENGAVIERLVLLDSNWVSNSRS
jgi:hypothetical protein